VRSGEQGEYCRSQCVTHRTHSVPLFARPRTDRATGSLRHCGQHDGSWRPCRGPSRVPQRTRANGRGCAAGAHVSRRYTLGNGEHPPPRSPICKSKKKACNCPLSPQSKHHRNPEHNLARLTYALPLCAGAWDPADSGRRVVHVLLDRRIPVYGQFVCVLHGLSVLQGKSHDSNVNTSDRISNHFVSAAASQQRASKRQSDTIGKRSAAVYAKDCQSRRPVLKPSKYWQPSQQATGIY
jgi:hypothetical protein